MRKNSIKKLITTVSLSLAVVLGTSAVAFASWWQQEWFHRGNYVVQHKGWCDSSGWFTDCDQEWKSCTGWTRGHLHDKEGPGVNTWTTAKLRKGDKEYSDRQRCWDKGQSDATVEQCFCGIKEYTGYTWWDIAY